jgi:hypothetical protein
MGDLDFRWSGNTMWPERHNFMIYDFVIVFRVDFHDRRVSGRDGGWEAGEVILTFRD